MPSVEVESQSAKKRHRSLAFSEEPDTADRPAKNRKLPTSNQLAIRRIVLQQRQQIKALQDALKAKKERALRKKARNSARKIEVARLSEVLQEKEREIVLLTSYQTNVGLSQPGFKDLSKEMLVILFQHGDFVTQRKIRRVCKWWKRTLSVPELTEHVFLDTASFFDTWKLGGRLYAELRSDTSPDEWRFTAPTVRELTFNGLFCQTEDFDEDMADLIGLFVDRCPALQRLNLRGLSIKSLKPWEELETAHHTITDEPTNEHTNDEEEDEDYNDHDDVSEEEEEEEEEDESGSDDDDDEDDDDVSEEVSEEEEEDDDDLDLVDDEAEEEDEDDHTKISTLSLSASEVSCLSVDLSRRGVLRHGDRRGEVTLLCKVGRPIFVEDSPKGKWKFADLADALTWPYPEEQITWLQRAIARLGRDSDWRKWLERVICPNGVEWTGKESAAEFRELCGEIHMLYMSAYILSRGDVERPPCRFHFETEQFYRRIDRPPPQPET